MGSSGRYLGIDIGGTSTKVCLLGQTQDMFARYEMPAEDLRSDYACNGFARRINAYVRQQDSRPDAIRSIGIALPGIVDGGQVTMMPNAHIALATLLEQLRDEFPYATLSYLNDANAALYAECKRGFGGQAASVMLVTLGAGVGSAYAVDGKLVGGAHGAAGEIGHLRVVKSGRRCGCGHSGCLEQYASAKGIVRTFRETDAGNPTLYSSMGARFGSPNISDCRPRHDTDAASVFKAFEQGDTRALRAVEMFAKTLGLALAQVACVLDPDMFLLGGGVSHSFELFCDPLLASYRSSCLSTVADTPIYRAQIGPDAGCLGAALYAIEHAD